MISINIYYHILYDIIYQYHMILGIPENPVYTSNCYDIIWYYISNHGYDIIVKNRVWYHIFNMVSYMLWYPWWNQSQNYDIKAKLWYDSSAKFQMQKST